MRLKAVERGEHLADRLLYAVIRVASGFRAPDVVRTLRYRKVFFGQPHSAHTQAVMRGPSAWTVGERELFAAFVSRLNQCQFWTNAHAAVAAIAFDETVTQQVLDDFESAPIDAKLMATLRFLRKMTLEPRALTPDDARAVLQTGVDREALTHAIHVAYLFNVYDRLADSMGWHVPDKALGSYQAGAQRLLKRGYQ